LTIEIRLPYLVVLLIKLGALLTSRSSGCLECRNDGQRIVKEERHDLPSLIIREHLLYELIKARIPYCFLNCLIAKLRKLPKEELLCCRWL
jgi:hypothetical protein